jgi:hypothetical protein
MIKIHMTELLRKPGAPPAVTAPAESPIRTLRAVAPLARLAGAVLAAEWRWDLLVLVLYVAVSAALFKDAWLNGLFYKEFDTTTFYYPALLQVREMIQAGQLRLWTPEIFAGFALYADGESGLFYPPVALVLFFFNADVGLSVLRFVHYVMAAAFTYGFLRAIGLNRWGAALGGLTFAYGSFLVMQMHHQNVVNSAPWLPFILWFTERWLRRQTPLRVVDLALAGVGLAMMSLGVHVQIVLMAGMVFTAWVTFRVFLLPVAPLVDEATDGDGPVRRTHVWLTNRLGLWVLTGLAVPAIGFGLAGVQLAPMYELAAESWRGSLNSIGFSNTYNASWFNLSNFVLPYLFRDRARQWWTLWAEWETNLYVGIVPLVLIIIAVLFVRRRQVAFWTIVFVGSFLLTLGLNAPVGIFEFVWQLPGFSLMRAPGRFSYVLVFAGAVLAAYGIDWLVRTLSQPDTRRSWWNQALRLGPVFLAGGMTVLLTGALVVVDGWLEQFPRESAEWIRANYLTLSQGRLGMQPDQLVLVLQQNISPDRYHTSISVLLFAGATVVLGFWAALPRLTRLWASGLVALTVVGGLLFAVDFHPLARISDLTTPSPAVQFLQQNAGLHRQFVKSDWFELQPNQLMPWGIATVAGYSSLQPTRHSTYLEQIIRADSTLLDLAGVRYLITPKFGPTLPQFRGVAYYLRQPLVIGTATSANSIATFSVPSVSGGAIRFLGNYEQAQPVPAGTPLMQVTLWDEANRPEQVILYAGEHLGPAFPANQPSLSAAVTLNTTSFSTERVDGNAANRGNIFWSEVAFEGTRTIVRIRFEGLSPDVNTVIHGAAIVDPAGRATTQVVWDLKEKYRLVFEDPAVVVLENSEYLPKAFVVPQARVAPNADQALWQMIAGRFDPTRTVILEPDAAELVVRTGDDVPRPSAAEIQLYEPHRLSIRVESPEGGFLVVTDSWYPGWRAYVDGVETPVVRGNYLFRAIPVSPGSHQVEMVYEPLSIRVGLAITLVTGALVLAAIVVAVAQYHKRRHPFAGVVVTTHFDRPPDAVH